MLILLMLPLLAHADGFSDRARQSYAQQEAARNIAIIQKMLKVEKDNGGVNATGKCYDTTYDFKHSWIPVPWQSGGYSMPHYSRRTLEGQRRAIGEAFNGIMVCTFNTQNG
jgi:hypothetical protein